jgi:NAD(P)-dependent dehydrogenase (short-subunit alcohol dehydrogenase family)
VNICRNIVITGVARGLGRALAEKFIALGHRVAGCGRDAAAIQKLQARFPGDHHFSIVDVADDARVRGWAERVLTEFGTPDLLLNNAAVINRNAPLWEVSAGEFERVIDINLKGVANVIRHFTPAMIQRGRGVIVNFSSGWGRSVSAEVAPYCATKWAIEGLTKALAEELPRGLAAVPLNPGVINTEMLQSCLGGEAAAYPTPEQWAARAVPFLLELGPKDNGQSLSVG